MYKRKNIIILLLVLLLVAGGTAGTLRFYWRDAPVAHPVFECKEREVRLGRIPVKNGRADWEHVFVVKNKTQEDIKIKKVVPSCALCMRVEPKAMAVPKNGELEINVKFYLLPHELKNRALGIAIETEDPTIKPYVLDIRAKAAFSTIALPPEANFANLFIGEQKAAEVILLHPAKDAMTNFLSDVTSEKPDVLTLGKPQYKSEKIVDTDGEVFYENVAIISVTLTVPQNSVVGSAASTLKIFLRNGEKLTLPVSWNIEKKKVFEPQDDRYSLIAITPKEKRDFRLFYNEDGGGKVKDIRVSGKNLSLLKTEQDDKTVHIQLRYAAEDKPASGEVGHLVVETQDGKTHKLPIIADVAEK